MRSKHGDVAREALAALFGWLLLWPLTFLIPRDSSRLIVIGRDSGKFLDNSKHFFVGLHFPRLGSFGQQCGNHSHSPAVRAGDCNDCSQADTSVTFNQAIFLTDIASVRSALDAARCRTGALSGPSGCWQLLRCGTAVVDSMDWSQSGRFTALRGARVVQLWHGVPLKRIELLVAAQIAAGLSAAGRLGFRAYRAFTGRHRRVDYLVSTSAYVARKAMTDCFHSRHWPATGYPRNDVLLDARLRQHPLMSIGIDIEAEQVVREARARGRGVVLYTPTFRKHFIDPFSSGFLDLTALDEFARSRDLLFLVKLHPWMRQPVERGKACQNVAFAGPDTDIYPLMTEVDILVTDYSSIFFDFLLLDRPIVFFCQDLEDYIKDDRGFIFDYDAMTPGPKVSSQSDMEAELVRIIQGEDAWRDQRHRVRELVHDHHQGSAVKRLMTALDGEG